MKVPWLERRTGRDHSPLCHEQNRSDLGMLIVLLIQSEQGNKKLTQIFKNFPPTPPFTPGSTSLPSSLLPSLQQCRGTEMGAVVSSTRVVPAIAASSWRGLLMLFPVPPWGSSHRKQSSMNFLSMSPSHRMHFTNCSSLGSSHRVLFLQAQPAPAAGPHMATGLSANLL